MLKFFLFLLVSLTAHAGVTFSPVSGFASPEQVKIIEQAGKKVNEVVASKCFADWMNKQSVMNETNGKSKEQVIAHLIGMNDTVPVKMYFRKYGKKSIFCPLCTSAVAYREPPHKVINLNASFFTRKTSVCRWAATMAHEGLAHALGNYGHSFDWTRSREDTVAYLLSGRKSQYGGDVFVACCR